MLLSSSAEADDDAAAASSDGVVDGEAAGGSTFMRLDMNCSTRTPMTPVIRTFSHEAVDMLMIIFSLSSLAAVLPPLRPGCICSRSCVTAFAAPFSPGRVARDGGTITEPAADWALGMMQRSLTRVDTAELQATIGTVFLRASSGERATSVRPTVLFLHGADFSCLEWRFVARNLSARGVDCVALDWWNGGWTDRAQILDRLQQPDAYIGDIQPWTLARQHIRAFWEQELEGRPVVLVGASLGGAVAVDFAATHPEAVSKLVLIDAGGESFKSPPPDAVRALAKPVLTVKRLFQEVQARLPSDEARIVSLHRGLPDVSDSSLAYLKSGGMAVRVNRELIRTVPQPTLVVWGSEDDILPIEDAYMFEQDLPCCVGVKEVAGSGHSPHLDNPDAVITYLADFLEVA